ncbi:MAG: SURF1 family protein [Bdellovibrionales bacterium]|jgi:surfeit locus 1 family protein|nr:SURF1 family protein [Bdellovibrionales bacterium]
MKFHKNIKIFLSMGVMLSILLALGTWQVKRLAWKEDLIARMDAQMQAAPGDLPDFIETPKDFEYRRVRIAGHFDAGHVFWVGPRTENGRAGAHMIVPLRPTHGGAVVFVNRGFVPDDLPDGGQKKTPVPAGLQNLEGIAQLPYQFSFTPDNNPEKNRWYWSDIPAFAAAAGYEKFSPVLVTLPAVSGKDIYPSGFAVTANIRNNHLQYALFWFGMAVILIIVFVLSQRTKPARPAKPE